MQVNERIWVEKNMDQVRIKVDPDIELVAAFMKRNIPCAKRVKVAEVLGQLAPLLWGHLQTDEFDAIGICQPGTNL